MRPDFKNVKIICKDKINLKDIRDSSEIKCILDNIIT